MKKEKIDTSVISEKLTSLLSDRPEFIEGFTDPIASGLLVLLGYFMDENTPEPIRQQAKLLSKIAPLLEHLRGLLNHGLPSRDMSFRFHLGHDGRQPPGDLSGGVTTFSPTVNINFSSEKHIAEIENTRTQIWGIDINYAEIIMYIFKRAREAEMI